MASAFRGPSDDLEIDNMRKIYTDIHHTSSAKAECVGDTVLDEFPARAPRAAPVQSSNSAATGFGFGSPE